MSSSFVSLGHRSRRPDKVRSLEVALAALGAEDVAAKRAREEEPAQSYEQACWSPDAALEHAGCKVNRFEEALKAVGDILGPKVEFLQDTMKRVRQAAQEVETEVAHLHLTEFGQSDCSRVVVKPWRPHNKTTTAREL